MRWLRRTGRGGICILYYAKTAPAVTPRKPLPRSSIVNGPATAAAVLAVVYIIYIYRIFI